MHEMKSRQLAVRIAQGVSETEGRALQAWVVKLLAIRRANLPPLQKARLAVQATCSSKVVWPFVKIVAAQIKGHGWDNRSKAQRLGLTVAALGAAVFGGQSAGVAALGGAIAVPLWVVLGAGSMFARYLYEEIAVRSSKESDDGEA
ncbi:hypothetical protein EN812_31090 [Mesorhizobium sp. M4B.F.Ca.ET.169.01.1.1]|uniref:hypothetical protein n=1 Tax=unclassified Mesorhizobium TaxID=325217 RepID=UPI000FCB9514|nr:MULTISPECIES: hypothetical protein [unclassified Mesorhizobium]RVD41972.1 hypothetical protein EN741_13155 [Mesorhizobium sp. M4B.F.Ca.ET.019.03.1.1]TGT37105.1 hypothetical protein EN812_31090 [Mesorhizobium sp. M4B.F.Ca.ET.169.01.1.1]